MRDHHFLDAPEPPHNICYNLVFSDDTRDIIPLPAPALFDYHARNGYTVMPPDTVAYRVGSGRGGGPGLGRSGAAA